MNKLTKQQRSQALGWVSVMGFSPADLADHYGLTADEIVTELNDERKARKLAGKSPVPVPVVANQGKRRLDRGEVLISCIDALQAIYRDSKEISPENAVIQIGYTAERALRNAGFLP